MRGGNCEVAETLLAELVDRFELVFDGDWDFTREQITAEMASYHIKAGSTFANPGVADEGNNWGNRGALLAVYRKAREHLMDEGIYLNRGGRTEGGE